MAMRRCNLATPASVARFKSLVRTVRWRVSWALAKEKITAIHVLEDDAYFLRPVSQTFHGRDVFAPVAAHLSLGVPIKKFGPALRDFVRLDSPEPRKKPHGIEGEVVYIDRFGNAITNLEGSLLNDPPGFDRASLGTVYRAIADFFVKNLAP